MEARAREVLEEPALEWETIATCLGRSYDLDVASIRFIPSHDPRAAAYEVRCRDGGSRFLKVRFEPVHEAALTVPRALSDEGVPGIMSPIPTDSSRLWEPMGDLNLVLYPFVRGCDAMAAGMSDDQWRSFGGTLRQIHDSALAERFSDRLAVEAFDMLAAPAVRRLLARTDERERGSPAASRLAAFLRANALRISGVLDRAEDLAATLRLRRFELVLCHADIHAANLLLGDDGQVHLIDWDGPMIAPRERDLLFVVGSKIARDVLPQEERLFFEGYGPVGIDADALRYYRYERAIEDIGSYGESVLDDQAGDEAIKEHEMALVIGSFAAGGIIETAELVSPRIPSASHNRVQHDVGAS